MILVTTALEETFPQNTSDEVLFLGEWCKIYNRKDYWSKFNSKTLGYHWDDRDKLYSDYQYLTGIYEKYLFVLSEQLNLIHGESHSLRYWRIIIGPWLRRFIDILYDRHVMIDAAFTNYKIDETYILKTRKEDAIANDMYDFIHMHVQDDWNHFIYNSLIESKKCITLVVGNLKIKHAKVHSNKIKKLSEKLNYLNNIVFFSSYIERKFLVRLQLLLKQVPAFDYLDRISIKGDYNNSLRSRLNLQCSDPDKFEFILQKLIKSQIPYSYLESYKKIKKIALNKYSPKAKIIVTANGYSSFDDFKIWMADRVDNGAKLIIHQHGGHYGTGLFSACEQHEISISDKYFSWGWKNKKDNIFPMPAVKLLSKIDYNPKGDILMPLADFPRYSYVLLSMPIAGQILNYIQDQLDFLSLLDRAKNIVKLRTHSNESEWGIGDRLIDSGFADRVDSHKNLNKNFSKRLSECRLCIATYNATTYLETFANNFPTLLFWDKNYWECNAYAQPYFDKLHKVGILHYDVKSLAKKTEEIYNNPMEWWMKREIQQAKDQFCAKFANIGEKPIDKWSKELGKIFNDE
jgi:putative transferase (TIGR04331 family)